MGWSPWSANDIRWEPIGLPTVKEVREYEKFQRRKRAIMEAVKDQQALESYRAQLIDFADYRQMLMERN